MKMILKINCKNCGKIFRPNSPRNVFCSRECNNDFQRKKKIEKERKREELLFLERLREKDFFPKKSGIMGVDPLDSNYSPLR